MVKKIPQGRVSSFLIDHMRVGDTLWCTPPSGNFFRENTLATHYLLLGAGSGITPLMSILKHVLVSQPESQVTLIYSNRHQPNIIFDQELKEIHAKHGERFQLFHILSQPPSDWRNLSGHLNVPTLLKIYRDITQQSKLPVESYLCGPISFMKMCQEGLAQVGLNPDRIHLENFGSSPPYSLNQMSADKLSNENTCPEPPLNSPLASQPSVEWSQPLEGFQDNGSLIIGDPLQFKEEKPAIIEAEFDGEKVEVKATNHLNILETLMNEGYNPPYSCMSGACMACMAKLEEGRIIQDDPGILGEENVRRREILTCQARPLSRKVKVVFCT